MRNCKAVGAMSTAFSHAEVRTKKKRGVCLPRSSEKSEKKYNNREKDGGYSSSS